MPAAGATTSADTSERVRYFPRQLLTAEDMRVEQEYFREKQRRHNRFLHGWGVVCGLEVKPDPARGALAVTICPGYALGPCGDEIYVPDPIPYDIGECVRPPAAPCAPRASAVGAVAATPTSLLVAIRYAECPTRPLRTTPAGCGCDDTACEYSRIRDGYAVQCRPLPGPVIGLRTPTICDIEKDRRHLLPSMPEPPSDPWVALASITLTGGKEAVAIDGAAIDNGVRRIVYSTAMIQQQLIACCCGPKK
jgi:hypothetical protein